MELFSLPKASQYRISAAEEEAVSVYRTCDSRSETLSMEAYWRGDPSWVLVQSDILAVERRRVIKQLFEVTVDEFVKHENLDEQSLNETLDAIGVWIQQEFKAAPSVIDQLKAGSRAADLRRRAAELESTSNRRESATKAARSPAEIKTCSDQRREFMARYLEKSTLSGIAMQSGVGPSSLYRWRTGESRLRPENLSKLADHLTIDSAKIPN